MDDIHVVDKCPCGWSPQKDEELSLFECPECEVVAGLKCPACGAYFRMASKCYHKFDVSRGVTILDGPKPCFCSKDCRCWLVGSGKTKWWACEKTMEKA